jgi:rod shape-determining protein MreD
VITDALKLAPAVFVLAICQVSVLPQLVPGGAGPDVLVVLVVALVVRRGIEAAAVAGFAGGLLFDGMVVGRIGLTSLLYVLAALAVERASRRLARTNLTGAFVLAVGAALLVQAGYGVLGVLLGASYPLGFVVGQAVLPIVAQTALVALPLLALLFRLFPSAPRADVPAAVPA